MAADAELGLRRHAAEKRYWHALKKIAFFFKAQ